jgi:pantoate--beta-alanine ligase
MGALHKGHLSLVQAARSECDVAVATIFVNPTQFGPHEDFQRYPRTLEADLEALAHCATNLVFVPPADEIYPPGFSTCVEPPAVAARWEGACRPGHFRGVATIVLKLFQAIPAHVAYFGQKDYQQCRVIERMVADLNVPIEVCILPTVREPDGLAMSSRNRYLQPDERRIALALYRSLERAQRMVDAGCRVADDISAAVHQQLAEDGVSRVEYVAVADPVSLEPVVHVGQPTVVLIAAYVGKTRLIDNVILRLPG